MFAIFLVGGLGTRLRPFTCESPKALLPVLNRPFISYQFELLKNTPVSDIVLAAGKGHKDWEKLIKRVAQGRFRIHFVYEKELLGTGGAIRLAYDQFAKRYPQKRNQPVLVFNGDVLFDVNVPTLINFHQKNKSKATVALTKVDDPSRFGLVVTKSNGEVTGFIEKPKFKLKQNYVNGGIYVFESSLILTIPPAQIASVERDTFPAALKNKMPLFGYKSIGYWNDIGTTFTYRDAHNDLLKINPHWTETKYLRKRGAPSVLLGKNTKIEKNVVFEGFVSLGNNVRLKKGCVVRNSVLHDLVCLDENVVVEDSVIGQRCVVGSNSHISSNTFLGPRSIIYPFSKI